jgi:hypothetical protein
MMKMGAPRRGPNSVGEYGAITPRKSSGASRTSQLKAGRPATSDEIIYPMNISELYELIQPGKYTIRVMQFDEQTNSFFVSNKSKVRVAP